MREMVKPHPSKPSSASSELSMHKGSQLIPKLKPRIRIVHIYAPEIIKTDAENFRELVQRFTGKPLETKGNQGRNQNFLLGNKNITKTPLSKNSMNFYREPSMDMETYSELASFQNGVRSSIKEEDEEVWRNENLSGFFDGFSDLDGFIEELSELPVH
ncbi:hypothetical protein FH972_010709 [Carpinus fangiana]|uniref:VQ domain-containing protein n=1 Tax=Carpinus fangiana TaxID=176857 RepID=A0A660KP23_9ROSI|nr:hypothetical protein FH972_010709 [Carpinus fangiana]